MIMLLALLPTIVLLVYIYKMDKLEKEPRKLLFKCFLWGVIIIAPVIAVEEGISFIFEDLFVKGSVGDAIVEGFIVAAFTEELFKFIVLKWKTWKSPEFNCFYDGIIYSVFVSVGFATLENVMYVLDGELSTALVRMFTAVPGHAYDAVFMGYFYSKAKKAHIDGNRPLYKKYKALTLIVPMLMHGVYDFLLSFEEEAVGESMFLWAVFYWFLLVIAEFIVSLNLVNKMSKNDAYFVTPGDGVLGSKQEEI
ncbi:MAG: PrsW family glutamic-type intramembrane protease [Lachnospiraceae bacterium]|nr:PrsW family glutamic-type intramembrane protease [Lachnospiraceae bacterium]